MGTDTGWHQPRVDDWQQISRTIKIRYMKNSITLLCIWTAVLLLAGCDVKDPIYNTPHPDKGQIILTTDWMRRTTGVDIPANYTVASGEYMATVSDVTNTLDRLLSRCLPLVCLQHAEAYHHERQRGNRRQGFGQRSRSGSLRAGDAGLVVYGRDGNYDRSGHRPHPYRCDAAANTPADAFH